eukprot:352122-Chlamydomonas_euryale.AAC.15
MRLRNGCMRLAFSLPRCGFTQKEQSGGTVPGPRSLIWGLKPHGITTRSAGRGGSLSPAAGWRRTGGEQSLLSSCMLDPIVWDSAQLGQAKGHWACKVLSRIKL